MVHGLSLCCGSRGSSELVGGSLDHALGLVFLQGTLEATEEAVWQADYLTCTNSLSVLV